MKKNVYSLVLSEDVVHEIDKLAYQRGTNRSNMVNQILAEYASLITPEKRMSHLLAEVRRHFESAAGFQLPEAASAGMMNLRTALRYKYNPTVRYSLELSRDNQSIGTLRVSLRTQNTQLIMAMVNFYGLWDTVETVFLGRQQSLVDGERYLRVLMLQSPTPQSLLLGSEALGELIADYISTSMQPSSCIFRNRSRIPAKQKRRSNGCTGNTLSGGMSPYKTSKFTM